MVKRVESVPAVMVMVADSLTEIVAALVEVEVFSAKENEVELVKVGAVVSTVIEREDESFVAPLMDALAVILREPAESAPVVQL